MALGARLLTDQGQLVAITPRSFANGPYFEDFRRDLLSRITLDRVHLFESRSSVFADTGVLQENVIVAGTRQGADRGVVISVSKDHTGNITSRTVASSELVHPGDPARFIHIPTAKDDAASITAMAPMPCSLSDLGLSVSTGRVVDFRCRDHLAPEPGPGLVPLVYPGNVRSGMVEWPRPTIGKPQGFLSDGPMAPKVLLSAGVYVLVKRFSSKEERRRVVAGVWDPQVNGSTAVAFENHLNVIHCAGAGLDLDFGRGLNLWLNSSLVDRFFRTLSGHTQVNATDLRLLRFPPIKALQDLGQATPGTWPEQEQTDALVDA